eukprot:TRINITY_DN2688_c0_g1_i1.p1 TRINITY_DN2688_c0_g1~~TRINITY_DN2688_c0_g1_i1.p1  ORF type:complete len:117 (+),score=25.44 TRINITY_DN2688_c0_g1_i1:658-1008(+)
MSRTFHQRVKSGEVKVHKIDIRSPGSKGYKFDETEASRKDEQKKREGLVYGASADKESALERQEEEDRIAQRKAERELEKKIEEMKEVEVFGSNRETTCCRKSCCSCCECINQEDC